MSPYFSFFSFLQAWKYLCLCMCPTCMFSTYYVGHYMFRTLHHLLLTFFPCLLIHFSVFRISNPLSNFIATSFLSNSLQNIYNPPISLFIIVPFFFQLSKHLFCNPSKTIDHLVPHHRSFSLKIIFSPIDHFILKCGFLSPFQMPPHVFIHLLFTTPRFSTSNGNI